MSIKKDYNQAIYRFGKKVYLFSLLGRSILFLLLISIAWLSIIITDAHFYFSSFTRWGFFILNTVLVILLFYRIVYNALKNWIEFRPNSDLSDIAQYIGKSDARIQDKLVNLYQLGNQRPSPLQNAAIEQLKKEIDLKEISKLLRFKAFRPHIGLISAVFLTVTMLIFTHGAPLWNASLRMMNPSESYLLIPEFHFSFVESRPHVYYNQNYTLKVQYSGPEAEALEMLIYEEDKDVVINRVLLEAKNNVYTHTLKNVLKPFAFKIQALPALSEALKNKLISRRKNISLLRPPIVNALQVEVESPTYSALPRQILEENNGSVLALKGSKIHIKLAASKPLKKALLHFENSDSINLSIRGKTARSSFRVQQNDTYRIHLTDTENLINQSPITYTIATVTDAAPFIDIAEPGSDMEMQLDEILALRVEATDDYGINDVFIEHRTFKEGSVDSNATWQKRALKEWQKTAKQVDISHRVDFNTMFVGYGDVFEYRAVAIDNNIFAPARSESPLYRISFPSFDDIFTEFNKQEEEKVDEVESALQEADALKEDLQKIKRELNKNKQLNWEQKNEIESAINKQMETINKINQMEKDLKQMVENLEKSGLMDPEMLQQYQQLQNMFNELTPPELLNAMKNLQKSMEQNNMQQVENNMEKFQQAQDQFKDKLERTLELFKQVQLEQQLDQLVQQSEKLEQNQSEIAEKLSDNELSKQEKEALQKTQSQQKKHLQSLEEQLDKTAKMEHMSKFSETKEQLKTVQKQLAQAQMQKKMDETLQQMQNGNNTQAQQNANEMKQTMQQTSQSLKQAAKGLKQRHKNDVARKMQRASQKLLQLSHQQEQLERETRSASQLNDDLKKMGRKQAKIKNNLEKVLSDLVELSQKTFFMDDKLGKNIASAQNQMQQSLNNLSERANMQSASAQKRATEALNRGVRSIASSMSQMQGAGSGTGFESFLEQLEKMSGMQGGLNSQTMQFMPGEGGEGQLPGNQQARRLAAQQEAIKQAMDALMEKMGNRRDMLGRLGELGKGMDEVIQDLLSQNINRKTIERQRAILSRMLDAQKSVREREFSKKRKARKPGAYSVTDPKKIKNANDLEQKLYREALKNALKDGYHKHYQELIELYFKSLSNRAEKTQQ